jgi:glycine/D-amino acid oxidase-like deaminating enzyme
MPPPLKKILGDERLPAAADVVVIGGGIVGTATAYYLARSGVSVALLEKGHVGCEQSSRTWGWCRQQNRDIREMPLAVIAMQLWDALAGEIGQDLGFRRSGLLYGSDDAAQLAEWESWRSVAKQFDVDTRMMTAAEAMEKIPQTRRKWLGGLNVPVDGKAEPALAAPLLAEGARTRGATVHQDCAAYGLEIANRTVMGVHTSQGFIKTGAVVCAGGAWASSFVRSFGVSFPQASVRQTVVMSQPAPNIGEVVYTPDSALTRRLDGSYYMAISGRTQLELTPQGLRYAKSFMPMFIKRLKAVSVGVGKSFVAGPESWSALYSRDKTKFGAVPVLDPPPVARTARAVVENVRTNFPGLADIKVADAWGAFVDSTPDAIPVIGPVETVAGVYLAAGCSGHGFGLGPGIGYLAAQLVTNDTPCVDPSVYRLSRLLDGSKVKVGSI